MAKQQSKKNFKVQYRGAVYTCTMKGGKVSVRTPRTANGQNLLAGVYNPADGKWQNEDVQVSLPTYVRKEVEKTFMNNAKT